MEIVSILTDILFGKKLQWEADSSKEVLLERLAKRTAVPVRFKVYKASTSYVGKIEENEFTLRLQHKYRSGLSPKIQGMISEKARGANIQLYIRVSPYALLSIFALVLSMIGIAIWLVILSRVDEWMDIIMMVPLLIFLLILLLTILKVQYEIDSIVRNLKDVFMLNDK